MAATWRTPAGQTQTQAGFGNVLRCLRTRRDAAAECGEMA